MQINVQYDLVSCKLDRLVFHYIINAKRHLL